MDCWKCQELLSDFVDGTLEPQERVLLSAHLHECLPCAGIRDDLKAIVGLCREHRDDYVEVPNQRALWLRISNVVESERSGFLWAGASKRQETGWRVWWSELASKRWEFSLSQITATVAAIMIAVSVGTLAGLRFTRADDEAAIVAPVESIAVDAMRQQPAAQTRNYELVMRRQQTAMDYWNRRVEQRKARWSPRMRDAFDRNMHEVDLTVNDALTGLQQNPDDGVAGEMLDTAMNEKMELLREFSDL